MVRLVMLVAALCSLSVLVVGGAPAAAQSAPNCAPDEEPVFAPEFLPLREHLGGLMGAPVECAAIDDEGDLLQETTTGLAVYFTAAGVPAFTNGTEAWALTPDGLLYRASPGAEPVLVTPPAITPAVLPPAPPAAAPTTGGTASGAGAVAVGRYECYAFSGGRLVPRPGLNFAITGPDRYTDVAGTPGTYTFDPSTQGITFHGGALDGQRARYNASRTPRQIAFLTARGDLGDTCDHQP